MDSNIPSCSRALLAIVLLATTLGARAERGPPPAREIKKTVDTFVGHWTLTGTNAEPDTKVPASVKATIDCKPQVFGAAVSCLIAADVSGTRIEAVTIIGFSPDENGVRWMEISSTGEFHNHRGVWKGNEIQFEPLSYTVSGEKMTEHFSVRFPSADKMLFTAITQTSTGTSRLELTGTRRSR
jgi:hypothetical protein